MRAIERAAIESGAVTGLELMERAGRGVVDAVFAEWPELKATSHRAVVLCGPGNNGGDGFVVARLLKEWGWEVEVFLYGDPAKLPPDARVNYERWLVMGVVAELSPEDGFHDPWAPALIVDALFGTGLSRPLDFTLGRMLPDWDLRDTPGRPRVVAVDVPSGLCADSGRTLKDSDGYWADLTVSFHDLKRGHVLAEGPFLCGKVVVHDIGLPRVSDADRFAVALGAMLPLIALPKGIGAAAPVRLAAPTPALGKGDPFGRETHKYSHGHAFVLSGGPGRGGAGRLAARGALRIGAGLVTVGCPPGALAENAARLDAVMLREIADSGALARVLEDGRINALCLGPGLGLGAREAGLVAAALGGGRGAQRALVLDADALTILAREPALFAALHERCVLTPHAGEFARLFPDIAAKLAEPPATGPAYSKVDATRDAAARAGCVVLYKGPDTVIAAPDGACRVSAAVYERAVPWLATAGAGDVLSGFITGLLARGYGPTEAAETAAWLHVECARSFGPGLIAEDLPEELPKVLRARER